MVIITLKGKQIDVKDINLPNIVIKQIIEAIDK